MRNSLTSVIGRTTGRRPSARKQAGVPTARNGPPERIPRFDWDAGVSEHDEKNRMFVRGLLTPEAEELAIVGLLSTRT
jgi:hypothetical protein